MAVNRAIPVFKPEDHEVNLLPYVVRLLAFLIFLGAILDKNLRRT